MAKKRFIIIGVVAGVIVAAAAAGVVALNVKTVKVSSDLTCRVAFGKMSDGEAKRVLATADGELLGARKYPFARDAYRAVVDYHRGEWRDDALVGMAQTFLGEGKPAEAYPWLATVVKEYPRGSAVEQGRFGKAVGGELGILLAKPPLDYVNAVNYLNLLAAAGSPDAPAWRQKFEDIVETPFTLTATYQHEKELAYVVRETATKDARTTALFYGREKIPAALSRELARRVAFGAALPQDKLAAFLDGRTEYATDLNKVSKKDLDDQAKVRMAKEREDKGLGALPTEWADAFAAADEDTGWTASAEVVGQLKDVTIAEILTSAGVDPFTGKPAAK